MADLAPVRRGPARADWHSVVLAALAWGAAAVVVGALGWIVVDLLGAGARRLSWQFLTTAPQRSGRSGGIAPMLVSTALILATCLAVAVPLAIAAAAVLAVPVSSGAGRARRLRIGLDLLAGVPSIIFGLFGAELFCRVLGLGFSILSGGLTLACMALPIMVRVLAAGLAAAAGEHGAGAAALGLSRTTTLLRLLLPAAAPAFAAALALGVGRALAETAALIFTSGYVDRMPGSLLDSGRALSVHIYDLAMNVPGGDASAHATALVLMALVLAVDGLSAWLLLRRRPWPAGA